MNKKKISLIVSAVLVVLILSLLAKYLLIFNLSQGNCDDNAWITKIGILGIDPSVFEMSCSCPDGFYSGSDDGNVGCFKKPEDSLNPCETALDCGSGEECMKQPDGSFKCAHALYHGGGVVRDEDGFEWPMFVN